MLAVLVPSELEDRSGIAVASEDAWLLSVAGTSSSEGLEGAAVVRDPVVLLGKALRHLNRSAMHRLVIC